MEHDSLDQSIANLKELNTNVTKGRWWVDSHGSEMVSFLDDNGEMATVTGFSKGRDKAHRDENTGNLSYWNNDSDASWIVTAQPQVVMGIIARMEEAEAKLAAIAKLEFEHLDFDRYKEWTPQVTKGDEIRGSNRRLTEIKGIIDGK